MYIEGLCFCNVNENTDNKNGVKIVCETEAHINCYKLRKKKKKTHTVLKSRLNMMHLNSGVNSTVLKQCIYTYCSVKSFTIPSQLYRIYRAVCTVGHPLRGSMWSLHPFTIPCMHHIQHRPHKKANLAIWVNRFKRMWT